MSPRVAALRGERGFTLAQMLVVGALLGTVMAGLLSLVMAGLLSLVMVGQQSATATMNKVDARANARMSIDRVIEGIHEAGNLPEARA